MSLNRFLCGALLMGAISGCAEVAAQQASQQRQENLPTTPDVDGPGVVTRTTCNVVLEVKQSTDEHLKIGQWLQIIGPLPPDGDLILRPRRNPATTVPGHEWRPVYYEAKKANTAMPPTVFLLSAIRVRGATHTATTTHPYTLTVTYDNDDCVETGLLTAGEHPDGVVADDHGGHASIGR